MCKLIEIGLLYWSDLSHLFLTTTRTIESRGQAITRIDPTLIY